jgi:hypothetical protein
MREINPWRGDSLKAVSVSPPLTNVEPGNVLLIQISRHLGMSLLDREERKSLRK